MHYSLYLGKISGIKIFVHWTFTILIAWIVFSNQRAGLGLEQSMWSVLFILAIFACVTLHELGHAISAKWFNIKTKDITLLPIGGLARLESIPEKPKEELIVALAGPAVNIGIVLLLYPIVHFAFGGFDLAQLSAINADNFLVNLMVINLWLAVFNMIPAFPMDGGRVLRALLAFRMERQKATRIAAGIGQVLAIGFVFLGLFYNPFLVFIGVFIYLGAGAEAEYTQVKSMLAGYKVEDVLMRQYATIASTESIKTAVQQLLDGQCKNFLVMDDHKAIGTLSRDEIIKALSAQGESTIVHNVMNKELLFLTAEMPLEQAWQLAQQQQNSMMPVMQRGSMIGVLDTENIMEFIMVKEAKSKNSKA